MSESSATCHPARRRPLSISILALLLLVSRLDAAADNAQELRLRPNDRRGPIVVLPQRDPRILFWIGTRGPWDMTRIQAEGETREAFWAVGRGRSFKQAALSADGKFLALASVEQPGTIDIHYAGEYDFDFLRYSFAASRDVIHALEFSPDGATLAAADEHGSVRLWDMRDRVLLFDLVGHHGAVRGAAWRRNSRMLVSCGDDGTVRVWDAQQGTQHAMYDARSGRAHAVDWRPGSSLLAVGTDHGSVRLWDPERSTVASEIGAHAGRISAVRFSPDGSRLVTGGADELVRVWSVSPWKCVSRSTGHAGGVRSVSMLSDGRRFVVCQAQGCAEVRSLETGRLDLSILAPQPDAFRDLVLSDAAGSYGVVGGLLAGLFPNFGEGEVDQFWLDCHWVPVPEDGTAGTPTFGRRDEQSPLDRLFPE